MVINVGYQERQEAEDKMHDKECLKRHQEHVELDSYDNYVDILKRALKRIQTILEMGQKLPAGYINLKTEGFGIQKAWYFYNPDVKKVFGLDISGKLLIPSKRQPRKSSGSIIFSYEYFCHIDKLSERKKTYIYGVIDSSYLFYIYDTLARFYQNMIHDKI